MAVATAYFRSMTNEYADPGISVLQKLNQWKSSGGNSYMATVKMLAYDLETPEVEVGVGATFATMKNAMYWTHACVTLNGQDLIYKVTGIRQGRVLKVITGSESPLPEEEYAGTVIVSLQLDAVATFYANLTSNTYNSMMGRWSRLPLPTLGPMEPFQIRGTQMMVSRTVDIPSNIKSALVYDNNTNTSTMLDRLMWLEVSGTVNNAMVTYGFFVCPQYPDRNVLIDSNACPSLSQVLNDPATHIGMAASSIASMSISRRCPWKTYNLTGGQAGRIGLWIDAMGGGINIPPDPIPNSSPACGGFIAKNGVGNVPYKSYQTETVTVTLTDKEMLMGNIVIKDATGTIVGNIGTRYAERIADQNVLTIKVRTRSSGTMIVTDLLLRDNTVIRYPEGSVPYAGDTYGEYTIAQLGYDRELLAINQDKAMMNVLVGSTAALANGAVSSIASGGLGVVTAGVGIASSIAEAGLNRQFNEREFDAKKNLLQNMPDTLYNASYGFSYIRSIVIEDLKPQICVVMPDGVSDTELTEYTKTHGYPVTDYPATVTLADMDTAGEGFVQAIQLESVVGWNAGNSGEVRRIMSKQLMAGIHFKVVT